MLKIDRWRDLKGKFNGIAIIGNAPGALDYKIGPSIDSLDCVIRMNNYVLSDEFAPYIGSRTTVFVSNFFPPELKKSQDYLLENKIRMIWAAIPLSDRLPRWPGYLASAEKRFDRFDVFVPTLEDILAITPLDDARLNKWLRKLFLGHAELVPSTGLAAIAMALKLAPRSVLISGFEFFSKKQAHYFSPAEWSSHWGLTHHRFDKEPDVLAKLISTHPNVIFELALDSDNAMIRDLQRCANVRFIPREEQKHGHI